MSVAFVAFPAMPATSAATSGKTEVLVFFDAEDFTSNRANDTIRDLANLCTEESVRAQFAIVGYLAHEIMRYGRKDVVSALRPHVIGTQSLYHSIHPNILEKSDREDHELAYWDVYADELLGCKWIREMSVINRRSQSYFIELALDKLIELTGGYGDGEA